MSRDSVQPCLICALLSEGVFPACWGLSCSDTRPANSVQFQVEDQAPMGLRWSVTDL